MSGVRCLAVLPLPLTATMMTTTTVPYAFMLSPSVIVTTYFEKPFLTHDIGILIRSLCLLSCHSLTLSTHIQTFVTVQRVGPRQKRRLGLPNRRLLHSIIVFIRVMNAYGHSHSAQSEWLAIDGCLWKVERYGNHRWRALSTNCSRKWQQYLSQGTCRIAPTGCSGSLSQFEYSWGMSELHWVAIPTTEPESRHQHWHGSWTLHDPSICAYSPSNYKDKLECLLLLIPGMRLKEWNNV
jgi:hypothetical protein